MYPAGNLRRGLFARTQAAASSGSAPQSAWKAFACRSGSISARPSGGASSG